MNFVVKKIIDYAGKSIILKSNGLTLVTFKSCEVCPWEVPLFQNGYSIRVDFFFFFIYVTG